MVVRLGCEMKPNDTKTGLLWIIFFPLLLAMGLGCATEAEKKAAHQEKAKQYIEKQRFPEAVIELKNVIQLDPNDDEAHYELAETYLKTTNERLAGLSVGPIVNKITYAELLRRQEVKIETILPLVEGLSELPADALTEIEVQTKYEGYLARQAEEIRKFNKYESMKIPPDFVYRGLAGLSAEVTEKLEEAKPASIGQASRIPGVTPAAISILLIHVRKRGAA